MSDSELERRKDLSFLQAEGVTPLPRLQKGTEVTHYFSAVAYEVLRKTLGYRPSPVGGSYPSENTKLVWMEYFHQYSDELPDYRDQFDAVIKEHIQEGAQLYDLLQFCVRRKILDSRQYISLQKVMRDQQLGYRFVGNHYHDTPTLMPVFDEAEADANESDYSKLVDYPAARTHFLQAIEEIREGHFRGSVTESISGVESVLKALSGEANAPFGTALNIVAKEGKLHPALKLGLEKIYGWTNSPNGMRHSLSDESVPVGEAEARFMLSACLAFAAWLKRSNTT